MQRSLILLLIGLLWWQPLAAAWAETRTEIKAETNDAELIRLPADSRSFEQFRDSSAMLAQAPQADAPYQPLDRSDLWTNATYALAGTALANLLVVITIALLSVGQEATTPGSEAYLDQVGPFALVLDLVPALATPVFMHAWSPQADQELFTASVIGSLIATALQLALMTPIFLTYSQGKVSDTYYVVLPATLATGMLFQALGSAWGHELGQNFGFSTGSSNRLPGVVLSYKWAY